MAADVLNLHQKLSKIRKLTEIIQKNRQGFNYKYVSIDEILARVTAGMDKYGVSLFPNIVQDSVKVIDLSRDDTSVDRTGREYKKHVDEYMVQMDVDWTWVNDENTDDTITVRWFAVGSQKDPSQAMGSALTYSLRQFLANSLQIAQPETDPDELRTKQLNAAKDAEKAVIGEIVARIDTQVREYLDAHEDKKAEVKQFMEQHVKGGNYQKIKTPEVAAALLRDFQKAFIDNEQN